MLGSIQSYENVNGSRRVVTKDEKFMYVPLLRTLQLIVSNSTLYEEVQNAWSLQIANYGCNCLCTRLIVVILDKMRLLQIIVIVLTSSIVWSRPNGTTAVALL